MADYRLISSRATGLISLTEGVEVGERGGLDLVGILKILRSQCG